MTLAPSDSLLSSALAGIGRHDGRMSVRVRARSAARRSRPSTVPSSRFIAGEPMKSATKRLDGRIVDLVGRADLLQLAILQHRDLGRERHRLDLVVRDIDDRRAGLLMQPLDLDAHVDAQLGVEIGQRLVEQEHARLTHQRAAHRDALALAARKLARPPARAGARSAASWRPRRPPCRARASARRAFPCRTPCSRATDMFGIERVGLEHHRDVALRRDADR